MGRMPVGTAPIAAGLAACFGLLVSAHPAAALKAHGKPMHVWIKSQNPDYQVFDFRAAPLDDRSIEVSRPFAVAWDADNIPPTVADSGRKGRPDYTIMRVYSFSGTQIFEASSPMGLSTRAYWNPSEVELSALGKLDRSNVLKLSKVTYKVDGRAKVAIYGQNREGIDVDTSLAEKLTGDYPASTDLKSFVVNLATGGAYFVHFVDSVDADPTSVPAQKLFPLFPARDGGPKDLALPFAARPEQMETLETGFIALFSQRTGGNPRVHLQRYDDEANKVDAAVSFDATDPRSFFRILPLADGRTVLFEVRPLDGGGSEVLYTPLSPSLQALAEAKRLELSPLRLDAVTPVALKGGGFLFAASALGRTRSTNTVTRYTDDFLRKGAVFRLTARDKIALIEVGRGRAVVAYKTKKGSRLLIQGLAY